MVTLQLRIKNLGNIKDARIKVGNLTVFVGKNNTNKTWMAYVIHSIASEETIENYVSNFTWSRPWNLKIKVDFVQNYLPKVAKYIELLAQQERVSPFFTEEDIPFIKKLIKDYLSYVAKEFPYFISINKEQVKNLKITLYWPTKKKEKEFKELLDLFNRTFNQFARSKWFEDCFERSLAYECYLSLIIKTIVRSLFGNPFNLPVERNTLITFSNLINLGEGSIYNLSEIGASLRRILNLLRRLIQDAKLFEKALSQRVTLLQNIERTVEELNNIHKLLRPKNFNYNYPVPVKDFKDFVQRLASLKPKENSLNKLLLSFLQEIIEGEIKIDETGIVYKTNGGVTLPIMVSSSMIKSLGGLYAYIAYKAEENDLLIIDEPENNLHPRAQVKMVEFLSFMVNKGIRVLTTTHSPYIVDHLINLIEADNAVKSKEKNPDDLASMFFLRTKDVFIAKNKVSVYLFSDDGEVKNILDSETGIIDWETFSSVSEEISQLYYKI
ncbi:AAA family ATPase [Desulfurobacterium crinifex]